MNKAPVLTLLPLIQLALLAACGPDSGRIPSAPARPAARLADDEPPRYSEWSVPVNLGPAVNSERTDADPFISKDGLSLYVALGMRPGGFGGRDIWVSHRASVDDPWGPPVNLGAAINTAGQEDRPTLSVDGHLLYFASNRPGGSGDFDLWVSGRRDKRDDLGWEPPINLGSAINTPFSEQTTIALIEDDATGEKLMYFASRRPGGAGDWDIYASVQLPDGTFGPATLVDELSTVARDRDPVIRRDGLEMFLVSDRPGTYGGLDLWVATRSHSAAPWSTPVSLGPMINSPTRPPELEQANDFAPSLSWDGTTLYFAASNRPGNIGFMFDIWVTTRTKVRGRD